MLLLPLLLIAFSAYSQPTRQVCIPTVQAAKIADSLAVLPAVRREASAWQAAAGHFQTAADSLRAADAAHYRAFQAVRGALQDQRLLTANETASAELWRHRARKRGLLTYALLALLGGAGYVFLKP